MLVKIIVSFFELVISFLKVKLDCFFLKKGYFCFLSIIIEDFFKVEIWGNIYIIVNFIKVFVIK